MLTFTNNYPNSKLTLNILNNLPNILYNELIKSKYDFTKCLKFIKTYPLDIRIIQLDNIIFNKVSQIDSVSCYEKYINLFENGIFKNIAQNKIDEKTISYEKIIKCYSLDTLNLFLNCENILSHNKVFLYQVCLALSINKLKENTLLKNVKNESIAKTIFPTYQRLIETDEEYSKENNYSEKIILEITKAKDILTFIKYNSFADSIDNIYRLMYEFSPYLNGYTKLYKANNTYIESYFSLEVIGERFITLFKCYGTRSSKIYEIFLVKNNFIQSVDLSHFENTMKNHLKTKFPSHECYSITTFYKFINNKNEILIYGDIYRSMRRKNLDNEFDGVCCPSYQFKAIANTQNNKFIVKTISSTKSKN